MVGVFSSQVCCCWPWTWQKMRPGLFQKHYAFCDGVLVCFQLSAILVSLIFNFFSHLLLYLKITSPTKRWLFNMYHLRHRLRIILFHKKVMFHYRNIQVFVFLNIPWFTKSVTSWWVLVHETGCIFEYIFWTTSHQSHQIWSIYRYKQGKYFSEIFGRIPMTQQPVVSSFHW